MDRPGKILEIRKIEFGTDYPGLDEISERLDSHEIRHPVGEANWIDFNYRPEVRFTMGYTDNEILLKFFVKEEWFKAEKTLPNQMVCEDSCVEFFVSPADDGIYYNMEFNGIGTCLLGAGTGRGNSRRADPEVVSKIRRLTSAGSEVIGLREGVFSWTITLAIPYDVFFRHKVTDLKGKTFRANFYKCGDKLPVPHYLSWNRVITERPDFHRPEFFGTLVFV